ncbi:MAG: A/G-specific adenine glycosylase [Lachnospiraceae bacterium]
MSENWLNGLYGSLKTLEKRQEREEELSAESRILAFREPLLEWYRENARKLPWRENRDPYRIWLSEIMLQQTRVEAVKPYFYRFLEEFPDIKSLAEAPEEKLLKLWEGLGYYSRAKNLQKCARELMEQYDGRMPEDFEAILKLPGIGSYTAGAIASIAFSVPVPAVDGNVLRVISRVLEAREDITKPAFKKQVETLLKKTMIPSCPGEFNQALIEIGALVCVPGGEPKCLVCPLAFLCKTRRDGLWKEIPYKAPKKQRKKEERTVVILDRAGKIALRKRPPLGLLASLYELPNAEGRLGKEKALELFGLKEEDVLSIEKLPEARHIFSHVEWDMSGYRIQIEPDAGEEGELIFADKRELKEKYPLPNAFSAYKKLIM